MTTGATSLRARGAGVVLRVIELDVEWLVEARRKTLQWRIVAADVCMADDAHRDRRRGELTAMTVSTGLVTWEARGRGVVGPFVTGVAGEGTVPLARVEEFGVVELRSLGGCGRYTKNHHRDTEDTEFTQRRSRHRMSLRFSGGRSAIR